jgi:ankyrin repeat protein
MPALTVTDKPFDYKKYVLPELSPMVYRKIDDAITQNNVTEMNRILYENNELITSTNYKGMQGTLLHYTIQKGDYPDIIKCLVTRGVNPNLTNSNGQTPYDYAKSLDSRDSRRDTIAYFEQLKEEEDKKSSDSLPNSRVGGTRRNKSKKSRKSRKSKKSKKSKKSRKSRKSRK